MMIASVLFSFRRQLSPKMVAHHSKRSLLCDDISEHDDDGSLRLTLDVPGIKESDIKVTLDHNIVKICGETKHRRFQKTMTSIVNRPTLKSKLSGRLADGVFTITAPPKAKPAAVRVSITANDSDVET